ncbi:MAG: ABC transporter permease, partial [Clostridia bacterium]|nr:ABC transporter permease [Clostridia bacterium]
MKYFLLQLKRVFKLFPLVAVLIAVLVAAFAAVFANYAQFLDEEQNSRFKVGVVGEADNGLFSMGIAAVKTLDTSRFSIDVIEISDENTAAKKLRSGEVAAYIVAPEGFTNAVSHGRIMPLKYCTTESYVDVSAIFKEEITEVVSTYLKESQKGIFAAYGALSENGYSDSADNATDKLAIEYMNLILARSDMYETQTTGFSFGLSIVEYTAIGLAVTFVCMFIIPFAALFTKKDTAFIKTLTVGGYSASAQVAAEFFAMLTGYISVLTLFIAAALAAKNYIGDGALGAIDL